MWELCGVGWVFQGSYFLPSLKTERFPNFSILKLSSQTEWDVQPVQLHVNVPAACHLWLPQKSMGAQQKSPICCVWCSSFKGGSRYCCSPLPIATNQCPATSHSTRILNIWLRSTWQLDCQHTRQKGSLPNQPGPNCNMKKSHVMPPTCHNALLKKEIACV